MKPARTQSATSGSQRSSWRRVARAHRRRSPAKRRSLEEVELEGHTRSVSVAAHELEGGCRRFETPRMNQRLEATSLLGAVGVAAHAARPSTSLRGKSEQGTRVHASERAARLLLGRGLLRRRRGRSYPPVPELTYPFCTRPSPQVEYIAAHPPMSASGEIAAP